MDATAGDSGQEMPFEETSGTLNLENMPPYLADRLSKESVIDGTGMCPKRQKENPDLRGDACFFPRGCGWGRGL